MSGKSDAECSSRHQKKDIFGKYEDKDYGICDESDTNYIDEDYEDQHYSRKKSKLDYWHFLLLELIDTHKTLSMKVCSIQ